MNLGATGPWGMSARGLAETIRSKRIPGQDVIDAHLRRIKATAPSVNAVTVLRAEETTKLAQQQRCLGANQGANDLLHDVSRKGESEVPHDHAGRLPKSLADLVDDLRWEAGCCRSVTYLHYIHSAKVTGRSRWLQEVRVAHVITPREESRRVP